MASSTAKVSFRIVMVILLLLVLFYVGRPLYWKISATVHDIRHNKQTVKQGLSQIVLEAQKSVGWYHDESDSGVREDRVATTRRFLVKHGFSFKPEASECLISFFLKENKKSFGLGPVACKVYWEYGLGLNLGWFIMPIEESTLALIIIILLNYSAHSSLYLEVTGFCFNI
ncbi:uncharacterized protein LOC115993733 isoform X1 [Quercus lobata]|uniref:uncharacterized protein LOC115993733 isoform X1 n=1 Tax=Quercus lobata TaxID=97700 RepID=UPI001244FB00|nr:uncharacterized protein LOC115993733 isoform X1 [Quercus lobata]